MKRRDLKLCLSLNNANLCLLARRPGGGYNLGPAELDLCPIIQTTSAHSTEPADAVSISQLVRGIDGCAASRRPSAVAISQQSSLTPLGVGLVLQE